MLADIKQKNEESRKALKQQKNEKTEAATPPNTD